jgi:multisubunit Na+/H+ antiporter MnhG subunit
MVLQSRGLRLSVIGAVFVAVGMMALVFMPDVLPALVMMAGGVAVIGGFMWTLAEYYLSPPPPPEER